MENNHFLKHIGDDVRTHIFDYLVLASVGIFFIVFLNLASGERTLQFFILLFFIIFYVAWGTVHHRKDQTLQLKILLEYILIGTIVLLLLQSLLSN